MGHGCFFPKPLNTPTALLLHAIRRHVAAAVDTASLEDHQQTVWRLTSQVLQALSSLSRNAPQSAVLRCLVRFQLGPVQLRIIKSDVSWSKVMALDVVLIVYHFNQAKHIVTIQECVTIDGVCIGELVY
jgi:hypothetical protein